MNSVVQDWISNSNMTLKMQTVLLLALRGCDGVQKEDISKKFVRTFRSVILKDAGGGQFMVNDVTPQDLYDFSKSLDHYPMHWLIHFIHAIQLVGIFHPDNEIRMWFDSMYVKLVEALHFKPEDIDSTERRLQDNVPSDCWKT